MKIRILAVLTAAALLAGCSAAPSEETGGGTTPELSFTKTDEEMFTDRDKETQYEVGGSVYISLNGNAITANSDAVLIEGTTVTIPKEGTYVVSGNLDNGQIVVATGENDKIQLVFNGAAVVSDRSAPLLIQSADKVFLTLSEGTENTLTGGESFDSEEIDGAIYSKEDLTINGAGSLTVSSMAGHGIVCNDDLVITGGNIAIQSASHGVDANDSIRFTDAILQVDAGKDGLHVENNEETEKGYFYMSGGQISVECEGDGISASAFVQIGDGTISILAGGGSENGTKENSGGYGDFMGGGGPGRPGGRAVTSVDSDSTSMKGIKAAGSMLISSGNITVDSADDTIHSNTSVTITGGKLQLKSGDDGVHADVSLNITGCEMSITECYEGLEAETIYISGGNIRLKASDDGLNAAGGTDSSGNGGRDQMGGRPGMGGGSSNGYIEISGGELYINSSGDGIDANGSFLICGGYTVIVGPTQGDTATLDYDREGKITGGTFIGTGASGMAQTFSSSEQGVIALRAGNQAAGTLITLKDSDGNTVLSYQPELSFAVVILSSPEIKKGESYTITVGSASGTFEAS